MSELSEIPDKYKYTFRKKIKVDWEAYAKALEKERDLVQYNLKCSVEIEEDLRKQLQKLKEYLEANKTHELLKQSHKALRSHRFIPIKLLIISDI